MYQVTRGPCAYTSDVSATAVDSIAQSNLEQTYDFAAPIFTPLYSSIQCTQSLYEDTEYFVYLLHESAYDYAPSHVSIDQANADFVIEEGHEAGFYEYFINLRPIGTSINMSNTIKYEITVTGNTNPYFSEPLLD